MAGTRGFMHYEVPNINGTGVNALVHCMSFPASDFAVKNLGSSDGIYDSNYEGVNGTFFYGGYLVGIAIQDSEAIRQYGLKNGGSSVDRNRGTIYCDNNGNIGVGRTVQASNLVSGGVDNIKWALGGLSLWLGDSLTKTTYDSRLSNLEDVEGVGGTSDKRPRTMMGYGSDDFIYLVTIVDADYPDDRYRGVTFWDGRTIMKNLHWDIVDGIHLDGGSSTGVRHQINYQDRPSVIYRHEVADAATYSAACYLGNAGITPGLSQIPTADSNGNDIWL